MKLKPQGKLLDPKCLFRVTRHGTSGDRHDCVSLTNVVSGKRVGVSGSNGGFECKFQGDGFVDATVKPSCIFDAVVVPNYTANEDEVASMGEFSKPPGVQVKLRCKVVAVKRNASTTGWLGKTNRKSKQRVVVVKSRVAGSAYEMVLIRRDGVMHPSAHPSAMVSTLTPR